MRASGLRSPDKREEAIRSAQVPNAIVFDVLDHAVVTPGASATPAFDLQPRWGVTELLLPG
jgi:hypothetical protein